MVAGVVAGFLSETPPPFVTGGGQTAANARDYLATKANWARVAGFPAIWSLIDETENPLQMTP